VICGVMYVPDASASDGTLRLKDVALCDHRAAKYL